MAMGRDNKAAGLEISDHSIKVLELERQLSKYSINATSQVLLPARTVLAGRPLNTDVLRAKLTQALADARPRPIRPGRVVFSLPVSQVYIHFFRVRYDQTRPLDELVKTEATTIIPLPAEDVSYCYRVLRTETGPDKVRADIVLFAASREVIAEWSGFFRSAGLSPEYFDIGPLAALRGLSSYLPQEPVILMDVGHYLTQLSIVDRTGLVYSYSFKFGGGSLSAVIGRELNLSPSAAEELIVEQGVSGSLDNEIAVRLAKNYDKFVDEIELTRRFYANKFEDDIKRIILLGGSSQIPGLIDHISAALHPLETMEGKPFFPAGRFPLEFIESLGLARKSLDRKWQEGDPSFSAEAAQESGQAPEIDLIKGERPERGRFGIFKKFWKQDK